MELLGRKLGMTQIFDDDGTLIEQVQTEMEHFTQTIRSQSDKR